MRAAGAEAIEPSFIETAEDEGWTKLEWFKLHFQASSSSTSDGVDIPPLPQGKIIIDVYSDFMRYLYSCAKQFIQDTHASGELLWHSLEDHIEFVLSHPNSWEAAQLQIQFVTEGEASLHFCIKNGLAGSVIKAGESVMIVDAGGGTVDLSSYTFTKTNPMSVKQIAPSDGIYQGSVYATRRLAKFLEGKLRGSRFGHSDEIKNITENFDKSTKRVFKNANETAFIKFGSTRDRDPSVDIKSGQLKLQGADVAACFEPSVKGIVDTIDHQQKSALQFIQTVFLVGGFAASPWLFSRLQEYLSPLGISLSRPDNHTNKAVADGAVYYHLDHYVSARVASHTVGTSCVVDYDPTDSEHKKRSHKSGRGASGRLILPEVFAAILHKGTQVAEEEEFRKSFLLERPSPLCFRNINVELLQYNGKDANPHWMDTEPHMFSPVMVLTADTSQVPRTQTETRGISGQIYYRQIIDIVLLFGLTELKAQISWLENGEKKRSPAQIVYVESIQSV